jgi:micrococcal nuclease
VTAVLETGKWPRTHSGACALLLLALIVMGSGAQAQAPGVLGFVTRVPTGDALYVAVGRGIETVRYIGIRTPEIVHPTRGREPYEDVAREGNRQLVEGKWVTLVFDAQQRDRYGQLLAYVYVGTRFVNAELVHQGYAEAATYPPNLRYQDYFVGLERSARLAGRGLWADREAQAYHRSRPPDEETGLGLTKSFPLVGDTGSAPPAPGRSGSPSPPNVSGPSAPSGGGSNVAPPMRGRRY